MLNLLTIRGRITDLRRFTNANRHRHPFAPAERYELWLRKFDGIECKLTIQTKTMPARSGHGISVIVAGDEERDEDDDPSLSPVVGVFNRETGAAANYLRTETPPFLRGVDFAVVAAGFAALVWGLGAEGMLLFAAAAPVYLFACAFRRSIRLALDARQVDLTIAMERVRAGIGRKKS